MAEYFEKDGLLLRLEDRQAALVNGWGPRDHYTRGFKEAVDMVRDHPAADAEPVAHGRWIYITSYNDGERVIATCLRCGVRGEVRTIRTESGLWEIDSPCCPDCGAKMDENGGVR